jgi:hypothetical protein
MTVALAREQLATLVAEYRLLNGSFDVKPFSWPDIYCGDCCVKLSEWSIEGDSYCSGCFSAHITRLVEAARTAQAEVEQLKATANALVAQAKAEGLMVVEFTARTGYGPDMIRCRVCCHEQYAYTIEGSNYCLNGAIAILREVLGAPAA